MTDPLPLAQALLRCRSVTPADDGAQSLVADALAAAGFTVHRLRFGPVENLFARRGAAGPHLCLAGHTDVVPAEADGWSQPPFGGTVAGGVLFGRGACDMKGAIAAFVSAAASQRAGSLSLLITGDEEGPAIDGTARVLDWMASHGQVPDACLVGEPTSRALLGDTVKIGRRGSLNATITVEGLAGHVAYPDAARNPIPPLLEALRVLAAMPLDEGSPGFQPSSLQVTSVDVGNPAANVIPARAGARLNIRFNDRHTAASLAALLESTLRDIAPGARLETTCNAHPFRTRPGPLTGWLAASIEAETGLAPALDTNGGTSDARFIAAHCPVAEFGLVGASMHQADERVGVADLRAYAAILGRFVRRFTGE